MKEFIAFVVVIAVLFLAANLFRGTYKAPEMQPEVAQVKLPLTCAVVVSQAQRQSGTGIP